MCTCIYIYIHVHKYWIYVCIRWHWPIRLSVTYPPRMPPTSAHISPIHIHARARTHRNTPGASQRQKKMCTLSVSKTTDGFMYASTEVKGFVGSLKSQVSFAENSPFYRALLQKRPIIWRSLLVIATPYASAEVKEKNVWACAIHKWMYGVATISGFLTIKGLFCRIQSLL